MTDTKEKADKFLQKGRTILKKWVYFGDKQQDALDNFNKSANLYKMIKEYANAAQAHMEMVQPHLKQKSSYDAANDYLNAAMMYQKLEGHEEDSIKALTSATDLYLDTGKFNRAAKCEEQLGEIFEKIEKFSEAIKHFDQASTYFDNENLKSHALDCKKRKAHLYALLTDYDKSIETFESVARYMANDKCLKWSAKEFFFKGLLVHFVRAGVDLDEEIENVKENFEKYKDIDVHFDGSDYAEFVQKLIEAFENESIKKFSLACKRFNERLDNWTTKICLRIKKNFEKSLNDNM